MTSVLFLSGPYPGHPDIPLNDIVCVAEFYRDAAEDAGWTVVCPSLWPDENAWRSGRELIDRLDRDTDAILTMPNWLRDDKAVRERQRAQARNLKIYAVMDGRPIPTPEQQTLCPHYRAVFYESSDRETCDANVRRCPPNARCPLRAKILRRERE